MLWMRPFAWVNRNGSAAIASTGVVVNTENVVFSFRNHAFVNANYRGTIFVNLYQAIPTGTTNTLPILFETNGVTQAVTKFNGNPLTVADIAGTGVYQFWFERDTNTLNITKLCFKDFDLTAYSMCLTRVKTQVLKSDRLYRSVTHNLSSQHILLGNSTHNQWRLPLMLS